MSIPYTESSLVLRLPSIQWRKKSIRLIKLSSSSAEIVVNARSDCSQSSFVLSLGIDWCWQRFRFLHRCAIVLTSFVFFFALQMPEGVYANTQFHTPLRRNQRRRLRGGNIGVVSFVFAMRFDNAQRAPSHGCIRVRRKIIKEIDSRKQEIRRSSMM